MVIGGRILLKGIVIAQKETRVPKTDRLAGEVQGGKGQSRCVRTGSPQIRAKGPLDVALQISLDAKFEAVAPLDPGRVRVEVGHFLRDRMALNSVGGAHILHAAERVLRSEGGEHARNKGEITVLLESADADLLQRIEVQVRG